MVSLTARWRWVAPIFLLTVVVSFGWFVWPTRYRYDRLQDIPVRIDRLSGRAEGLGGRGWFPLKGADEATFNKELPASEVAKLRGQCQIDNDINRIECDIYNGSDWTIDSVTISLEFPDWIDLSGGFVDTAVIEWDEHGQPIKPKPSVRGEKGKAKGKDKGEGDDWVDEILKKPEALISRNYKLHGAYGEGSQLESARFRADLGVDLRYQKWSWKIVGASGHK